MKQIFTLFFLVLSLNIFGQNFRVGPAFGYGAYTIATQKSADLVIVNPGGGSNSIGTASTRDYVGGTSFGLIAEYGSNRNWGVRIEPRLEQKGWSSNIGRIASSNPATEEKLSYMMIPISGLYYVGEGSASFFVKGGFQLGLLTKAELNNLDSGESFDSKSQHNTTDYGMHLGLGGRFTLAEAIDSYIEIEVPYFFEEVFNEVAGPKNTNIRGGIGFSYSLPTY